jgi:uncharacterized protein YndB with AHSA1/START domain
MNISPRFVRSVNRQPARIGVDTIACVAEPPSWTVNLERRVGAETRRVFDALTIPEYIEMWICLPGHHPECRNVTSQLTHGFQIEHHCSSESSTRIVGTYCSYLKRKLSFSWRPTHGSEKRDSLVDIRLRGDFERSILRLRHFGLDSEEDFHWHSALWSASIARLCRMFDGSSPNNETGQRRPKATREIGSDSCDRSATL